IPPIKMRAGAAKGDAVINLGKSRRDGGDIAAMAVQPVKPLKAMPRQALSPILHRRDHGGRLERDGAGKRHMMLRLTDIEGGANQEARLVPRPPRNNFRAQGIGAQKTVRPMLFG